jgi:hypothetical protein
MGLRKGIVTGAGLILLIGSAAHAADDKLECELKLSHAESLVDQKINQKLLSEDDVEAINLLLDEADEACTRENPDFKGANEALDKVNKLVSAATKPSQKDQ